MLFTNSSNCGMSAKRDPVPAPIIAAVNIPLLTGLSFSSLELNKTDKRQLVMFTKKPQSTNSSVVS